MAEAPPLSLERYFYFEDVKRADWLWIALMKVLYKSEWGSTKTERLRKRCWLRKFEQCGYRLIDAVKQPIRGTPKRRVAQINAVADKLVREVKEISPEQIVLVKATVHQAVSQEFAKAGLSVVNEQALPFPASGQQKEFDGKLHKLIKTGKLRLSYP
ncbi:MAG: hypothetical protein DMG26_08500 [Acidobacteria bacterium]|nr:MAG: hypothetical protein DMG26_08500 [Acidobacteriota bacterium]PYV27040.1 MAG: hypothetical protein DMG24_05665 [Acidobacteriota bacterium]